MYHLLILEMDGVDCIADHSLRLQQADMTNYPPDSWRYAQALFQPDLMVLDEPVTGAREFIEFLARNNWHVVLLRSCRKNRAQYHATRQFLKTYGFDKYYYDLHLKDFWFGGVTTVEWKGMKVVAYGTEGGAHSQLYHRIVYIDPVQSVRESVAIHWQTETGREIETYSGFTEFSPNISLGLNRPAIETLLKEHEGSDAAGQEELDASNRALDGGESTPFEGEIRHPASQTSGQVPIVPLQEEPIDRPAKRMQEEPFPTDEGSKAQVTGILTTMIHVLDSTGEQIEGTGATDDLSYSDESNELLTEEDSDECVVPVSQPQKRRTKKMAQTSEESEEPKSNTTGKREKRERQAKRMSKATAL